MTDSVPLPPSRLAYIDWLRGLACLVMFQTHCYDAWLNPQARRTTFFMWSQVGGTLPAPLFLFLAGISFALVTDKLRLQGLAAGGIARVTIGRGAEIFALALLFRAQEFLIALGWAPWSDLFRVDILNTIGMSMMLMGVTCWVALRAGGSARARTNLALAATAAAVAIASLAPLLWTTWRLHWLPWPIESYINGVHNLGEPQPWLFPIFPWGGFAFVGLALGFLMTGDFGRKRPVQLIALAGVAGAVIIVVARWIVARPWQIYPGFDFWHTSPEFFAMRVGILGLVLPAAYVWCRWGLGTRGFSPLIQLGRTSLLVYWVHIELVYGRVSILPKHSQTIVGASLGLLTIFLSMLLLSLARTRLAGRGAQPLRWLRERLHPA